MKSILHLLKTYNRDGIFPDIEKTEVIQNFYANIDEYVSTNNKVYRIHVIQNVFTTEDGQVRVYMMWENNDYELYLDDNSKVAKPNKIVQV